jgi:hypothetical protein
MIRRRGSGIRKILKKYVVITVHLHMDGELHKSITGTSKNPWFRLRYLE